MKRGQLGGGGTYETIFDIELVVGALYCAAIVDWNHFCGGAIVTVVLLEGQKVRFYEDNPTSVWV